MRSLKRFFLGVLGCTLLWAAPGANAADMLVKNAQVVNPATQTIVTKSLVIRQGKITQLLDRAPAKFSGTVVDAGGKYVLPAFVDMHLHASFGNPGPSRKIDRVSLEEVGKIMLGAGVTAYVDLFADEDKIFAARARQRKDPASGARLYAAGPMLTCPKGHGTDLGNIPTRTMANPAEARKQVASLSAKAPDFLKIAYDHLDPMPSIDKATLAAIVDEGKKRGIRSIVHIGTWGDARDAVEAGAEVVTHLGDTEIPDDLVQMMKQRGTWEIPTATYHLDLLNLVENRTILKAPLLATLISGDLLRAYVNVDLSDPYVVHVLGKQSPAREARMKSLKKLGDANIKWMAGTDSGDLGTFFGFSLHREMAIAVRAGLTTWAALAAATTSPKKFLRLPSGIALGEKADFVILRASPVEDIDNTQAIDALFYDGKSVDLAKVRPYK